MEKTERSYRLSLSMFSNVSDQRKLKLSSDIPLKSKIMLGPIAKYTIYSIYLPLCLLFSRSLPLEIDHPFAFGHFFFSPSHPHGGDYWQLFTYSRACMVPPIPGRPSKLDF